MTSFYHDKHFGAAFIAAPLFVGVLFLLFPIPLAIDRIVENIEKYILLILCYPLLEELAFRGLIQSYLYRQAIGSMNYKGCSVANAVTSLVFALFHLIYHLPIWALLTFFPSLIFGYFRDRYASVKPGMLLHVWYNAVYFAFYGYVA